MSIRKERPTIIYIAGPMTGLKDYNFPAFMAAERDLREFAPEAVIINPARNFDSRTDLDYRAYLHMNINQVQSATHIHLLDGWEKSKGAKAEAALAKCLGHGFSFQNVNTAQSAKIETV